MDPLTVIATAAAVVAWRCYRRAAVDPWAWALWLLAVTACGLILLGLLILCR